MCFIIALLSYKYATFAVRQFASSVPSAFAFLGFCARHFSSHASLSRLPPWLMGHLGPMVQQLAVWAPGLARHQTARSRRVGFSPPRCLRRRLRAVSAAVSAVVSAVSAAVSISVSACLGVWEMALTNDHVHMTADRR